MQTLTLALGIDSHLTLFPQLSISDPSILGFFSLGEPVCIQQYQGISSIPLILLLIVYDAIELNLNMTPATSFIILP